jgi:tetratricopeptide (TPR) repeat protein
MVPSNSAAKPQGEDSKVRLFRLAPRQKRLLRITFLSLLVLGGGIWGYLYISNAPQRAKAQFDEAMKLMKPGGYESAIAGFDRALKTWPDLAEAYLERGNAKHVLGRDDDAIADFEKAADLDPTLYRAEAAIGSIYRDRKDYRRATEAYTKSIAAKANVDALFERGQMYEMLGEHQKAIDDYDKAVAEMPDAPAVYRARALARGNVGDEAGAKADREEAFRIEHRR